MKVLGGGNVSDERGTPVLCPSLRLHRRNESPLRALEACDQARGVLLEVEGALLRLAVARRVADH